MAHPDKKRQGNEKGQREHTGRASEATDAGLQTKSQGARGQGPSVSGTQPGGVQGPAAGRGDDVPQGEAREAEGKRSIADAGLERSGGIKPPGHDEED